MGFVCVRTQQERDAVINLVSGGASFKYASEISGYTVDYVRQLCTKAGVYTPKFKKQPEREQKAVELLKSGLSIKEVAEALNYSETSIFAIKKKYKIEYVSDKQKTLAEEKEKITHLREQGYSMKQISQVLNLSFSKVSYICRNLGIGGNSAKVFPSLLEKRSCKNCEAEFECDKRSNKLFCSESCQREYFHRKHDVIRKRVINKVKVDNITLKDVADKYNNICYLCGSEVDWNDFKIVNNKKVVFGAYPSIDHIIPLFRGGTHSWDNVNLAHIRCNSSKGKK